MTGESSKTVTVEALTHHTYDGHAYAPGDTYAIAAEYAESVEAQGKAKRVTQGAPPPPVRPSAPVTPLSTKDLPAGRSKK